MFPLCSVDPFISTRVQGFWSPLLAVPFGRLSLHPLLFLSTQPTATTLTFLLSFLYRNVSFHHSHHPFCSPLLRFLSGNPGKWVRPFEELVFRWGLYALWESGLGHWDHLCTGTGLGSKRCCFNSRSVFLEWSPSLFRPSFS